MYHSIRDALARVGRWPRLLAAAACLLLALVSAVNAARGSTAQDAAGAGRTVGVVVAARDLPAGRTLRTGDLVVRRWPSGLRPPGAARRAADRVGARLAGPLRAGEPVTTTRLVGTSLTEGLAPGTAAVPVSVPDARAVELVRPGMHIELLATPRDDLGFGVGSQNGTAATGSVTDVARRLLVLASLPGADGNSTSLVVAADRAATLAIARAQSVGMFLAVPVSP